jgi:RNA polymerase sigma-70 factor (ECF subfamily)
MLRVQAGDLAAFEQLVERHQDMVYGLALSILRSPEDAEEAAQDAFLKLFRARDRFEPGRALEPWLLRIAGNVARDRLRRRRTAWLPTVADAEGEAAAVNVPDPASVRTRRDHGLGSVVRQELDRLSEKVRVPLELKYLRGLSNQQIADALGISLSNVKVQVARGKDILQSRLGREVEG